MILLNRIFKQRKGHFFSLIAYAADISAVIMVSLVLSNNIGEKYELKKLILFIILIIALRLVALLFFKRLSYRCFYTEKSNYNKNLIINSLVTFQNNKEIDIDDIREQVVYSSEIAIINFDIPISLIIGEMIVFLTAIIYLNQMVALNDFLLLVALALFVIAGIYIYIVRRVSKLGKAQIKYQEIKLSWLSNILNSRLNLAFNNSFKYISERHLLNETFCNNVNTDFMILNQLTTLLVELMLLVGAISVLLSAQDVGILLSASPIIARLAPSVSKIASYISQLAFGIQAVRKIG